MEPAKFYFMVSFFFSIGGLVPGYQEALFYLFTIRHSLIAENVGNQMSARGRS